jgi:hypothetical protein
VTARTSKSGLRSARGFDGGAQHLAATGGVDGQHADAKLSRLADGAPVVFGMS